MIKIKLHWSCADHSLTGDSALACNDFIWGGDDPPDPRVTAAAQTGSNVSTAVANAYLNNVNQVTPNGTLNYSPTGSYQWTDPSTYQTYTIPTFTATQTLSPTQQNIQNLGDAAQTNLAGLAANQSGFLANYMAQPFNLNGAPMAGSATWLSQPSATMDFGDAGPITRDYEDFAGERNRVEAGLMERLNPQLAMERQRYEQQLADQGIRYGSPAYTNAMDNYNRQANDARLGVIGKAGEEQQRMSDMAAQRAGFQNAAQQQAYGQLAGRAQFYNAAAAQRLQQGQSMFNAWNAQRDQWVKEQTMLRNQPINEITALLSGSQVDNPTYASTSTNTIPTTDIASIISKNYDQQLAQNQQASNFWGGVIGGGSNIISSALMRSDRNVKRDVEQMGTVFADAQDGTEKKLPIYKFSYKDDPMRRRYTGPMAQDVEKIEPRAVRKIGGVRHIDMPKLGEILKAA